MIRNLRIVPILVGVGGAILLGLVNVASWIGLVIIKEDIRSALRIDPRNLQSFDMKGIFPAEIMLAGGIVGISLLVINYFLAPLALGRVVRGFAKGTERLHGAVLAVGIFVLLSVGALTSIPPEPVWPGSSIGIWITLAFYSVSALSLYLGTVGVKLGRR